MHIFDSGRRPIRLEHLACFFATGLVVLMISGWCFPGTPATSDMLTRREVGLHLSRAVMAAAGDVELPSDLDRNVDADLAPMIASGYMGLFPDGTFRPDAPVRVGELLSLWARIWRSTDGEPHAPDSEPSQEWRWGAGDLSLLAGLNADAAARVSAFAPDAPATRELWQYLPLPAQNSSGFPGPAEHVDPAATGRVVDAITGTPIQGAVGTIDGKAFATDIEGRFVIPAAESDSIREVFVAVDGYRSLFLRWNRKLRPELKLTLKPFRAPLEIHVLTATGVPAKGVRVALEESPDEITDADGVARFRSVKPGYHRLSVNAPESETSSMLISVIESGGVQTVRLPASSAR